jgi:hypothetical protein
MMGNKKQSVKQQAELADIAYKPVEERPEMFGSLKRYEPFNDERIAVYKDDDAKKINIGFRGTQDMSDIATDLSAVILGQKDSNPYYQKAEFTVEKLKELHPDYSINVAGHSLGGNVAKYVASKNPDVKAFGYNTGSSIQDAFTQNPDNFYSFRNKTDIISLLDNPSNPRGEFYDVGNPFKAHGIGTFLNR